MVFVTVLECLRCHSRPDTRTPSKKRQKKVCRGLFEKDKKLFSFLIAVQVMRLELATISDDEWAFFLTKGQFIDEDNLPANPLPDLLSNGVMSALVNLQQLPGFSGIMDSLSADADLWTAWCSDDNPQVRDCTLP